jgi:cation/acetate symporter
VVGLGTGADPADGLGAVLLAPTVIAAPASALTVVVVSVTDPDPGVDARVWTRMHGTAADRQVERLARLTLRQRP